VGGERRGGIDEAGGGGLAERVDIG